VKSGKKTDMLYAYIIKGFFEDGRLFSEP